MTDIQKVNSQQPKKLRYQILKNTAIGFNIILSLCGLIFLILTYNTLTSGNKHTRYTYAHYDLIVLDKAIKEFNLDLNHYPLNLAELYKDTGQSMWMGPYIKEKELIDPWGRPYHYQYFPERIGYQLYTLGADHKVSGKDQATDLMSKGSLKFIQMSVI